MARKTGAADAKKAQKHQFLQLRCEGKTLDQIARQFKVHRSTVCRALDTALKELESQQPLIFEQMLRLQWERCEELLSKLWPENDHDKAYIARRVEVVLKVMERQAKLFGLDAPTKIDARVGVFALSDDELVDQARRVGITVVDGETPLLALPGEPTHETQRIARIRGLAAEASAAPAEGDGEALHEGEVADRVSDDGAGNDDNRARDASDTDRAGDYLMENSE